MFSLQKHFEIHSEPDPLIMEMKLKSVKIYLFWKCFLNSTLILYIFIYCSEQLHSAQYPSMAIMDFCLFLYLVQRRTVMGMRQTTRTTVRCASRVERSSCVTPVPERTTWSAWTLSWRRPLKANGAVHIV